MKSRRNNKSKIGEGKFLNRTQLQESLGVDSRQLNEMLHDEKIKPACGNHLFSPNVLEILRSRGTEGNTTGKLNQANYRIKMLEMENERLKSNNELFKVQMIELLNAITATVNKAQKDANSLLGCIQQKALAVQVEVNRLLVSPKIA